MYVIIRIGNFAVISTHDRAWFPATSSLWWSCLRGSQRLPSPRWCSTCPERRCGSGGRWTTSGRGWSTCSRWGRRCRPPEWRCCRSGGDRRPKPESSRTEYSGWSSWWWGCRTWWPASRTRLEKPRGSSNFHGNLKKVKTHYLNANVVIPCQDVIRHDFYKLYRSPPNVSTKTVKPASSFAIFYSKIIKNQIVMGLFRYDVIFFSLIALTPPPFIKWFRHHFM